MGRIQLYEVQVYNIVVDVVNHDGIPKVTGWFNHRSGNYVFCMNGTVRGDGGVSGIPP